jgi:hypothetical protein
MGAIAALRKHGIANTRLRRNRTGMSGASSAQLRRSLRQRLAAAVIVTGYVLGAPTLLGAWRHCPHHASDARSAGRVWQPPAPASAHLSASDGAEMHCHPSPTDAPGTPEPADGACDCVGECTAPGVTAFVPARATTFLSLPRLDVAARAPRAVRPQTAPAHPHLRLPWPTAPPSI